MIKISYNINEYRKDLENIIKPDNTIVELGCHTGGTSKIIIKNLENGKLITVDKSPESLYKMKNLKNKFPQLEFINGDVRLHETLKKAYSKTKKCDILLIDLGGGYHPDTTFKVFYIWSATLKPKHTLIRNRGIVEFINSSTTNEDFKSKKGFLESYNDEGIPPQIKEFKLWTSKL